MSDEGTEPHVRIIGGNKIVDLYGYWITFHDAVIESITIDRQGPSVTIVLTTNDMVCDQGEIKESDQEATVVIRWSRVREMSLSGVDPEERNWIDGLTFSAADAGIKTVIEPMDGPQGVLVAERVEVLEVVPIDPAS